MEKRIKEAMQVTDLKDMLNKSGKKFGNRPAYKLRDGENKYKIITHKEVRDMIDALGTKLIDMGLKDKRIAVIGENRYEWEIAYLSVVCGTGTVVPLDKALPETELESLIQRSEVEAIFYSNKYEEMLKDIFSRKTTNLKFLISMDLEKSNSEELSFCELINDGKKLVDSGDRSFIDAKIDNKVAKILLFTSGTTSKSKVVELSHYNIVSNLMDLGSILDVDENDVFLSILPIHHVFECTVGFLFSLYSGALTVFCDGIRHLVDNLKEYEVTFMANVPGMYERIYGMIRKQYEKAGRIDEMQSLMEKHRNSTMEERKEIFKEVHDMLGGHIKTFISGAAALDPNIEEKYRLLGINLVQGYGLTETSPVVAVGTKKYYRTGSIGVSCPSVEAKIEDANDEGIGELVVKGPSIMLGYHNDPENTNVVLKDGWFKTGDLARIDEDGYIFICGRKKSVIVLKNGKNIFPEEMEQLINKFEGVKESMIFGKQISDDSDNIKINALIVYDSEYFKEKYNTTDENKIHEIYQEYIKELNVNMPKYKSVRGIILTEKPLIKTTTNKIKRQDNLDAIDKINN